MRRLLRALVWLPAGAATVLAAAGPRSYSDAVPVSPAAYAPVLPIDLPRPEAVEGEGLRPPEALTASPGDCGFQLHWKSAPGATAYRVYVRAAHAGDQMPFYRSIVHDTVFVAAGLRAGESYRFYVSSLGAGGTESAVSDPAAGQMGASVRYVLVDRTAREVRVVESDRTLKTYSAGIGRIGNAGDSVTPVGEYQIVSRTEDPWFVWPDGRTVHPYKDDKTNPMGEVFLALNLKIRGRSIGIHGTCDPKCIGTLVSSGCVRLRNEDARELMRLVRVGTNVVIAD